MRDRSAVVSLVFALFFGWAASLQFNDPDPVVWVALYGTGALLALANSFWRLPRLIWGTLAGVCLLWGLSLLPGILSDGFFIGTEEERELGGLLIVGLFSAIWYWRTPSASKENAGSAQ